MVNNCQGERISNLDSEKTKIPGITSNRLLKYFFEVRGHHITSVHQVLNYYICQSKFWLKAKEIGIDGATTTGHLELDENG
ncbi:unnamed protein product [Lactuca virosa]|uniref:Uncharacterized protein n=1 Tax=Lactuca virosa TaxID=75947 RepID=A0AAU9NNM0_9ASTR|nr:unnamed protein product [Lactuca virosa]